MRESLQSELLIVTIILRTKRGENRKNEWDNFGKDENFRLEGHS